MNPSQEKRIAALPCWQSDITIEPLSGGMTNLNYKIDDGGRHYVVRLGEDDPVHLISRANEVASCRAAFEVGVSPELVYFENGVLVVDFIDGKVYDEADVRDGQNLERIVELLVRLHRDAPAHYDAVPVMFWVFQVLRHYHNLLRRGGSSHAPRLDGLARIAMELEEAVGAVDIVFGHNDLLPANFIDDGERLWLIDFDYAGFNSPLFDLSNLASNNELDSAQEQSILEQYFGHAPGERLMSSYAAMKCASLLRETMWSMVSEMNSRVDMDFAEYTAKNMARFDTVYSAYKTSYG